MDEENLMQAVMRSFRDADLRVEILPPMPEPHAKPGVARVNTGSGPARERSDATSQVVDGRYATVYKIHHCKVTPTSPPDIMTEFPPQRSELSPGCDNFQVGGMGSGETGCAPSKATCYRGGMTWASRGAVYAPRPSHCSDPFVSSLRKYPSLSPERSAEVLARLVTYSGNRSPPTRYSPRHSPPRHESPNLSYRNSKAYEESYAASCRPRAPDEYPTRERREEPFRKQPSAKHGDMRFIRDVSRRLRESLKSISSYTHTQTATACTDGRDREWYDSTIPETSETENDPHEPIAAPEMRSYPVNTTVQAVASTISREVETVPIPTPNKRTIAVPVTPKSSYSMLSVRTHDLPDPAITRSVQTFYTPGRSVETTTSSVELAKHDLVQGNCKKSKSLSDFRLDWDFKNEILSWLDDTSDPKIKEIQEMVLKNLAYRLKGKPVADGDRIKVRVGNCLKSRARTKSKDRSVIESNKNHEHRTFNQDVFRAEIHTRLAADQSDFEDVIKEWLNNISIKKRDILLRPVKKDQIYNTFVNRLKHLVVKQSEHCREQLLRAEIMEILDEVPIEINACDKTVHLERLTDSLVCRLESIAREHKDIESKPRKHDLPDKFNLNSNTFQPTEKETREFVVKKMVDVLRKQNVENPELVKEIILEMVDILMDSVNSNVGLEEIASLLHNATKLSENEAFKYATQLTEHWRVMLNEKYKNIDRIHPFTVFMVQNVPGNYITKTSVTSISQHSIGSIVDKDIEANLHQYKLQLAAQIDRWLSSLEILQAHDKDFRHAVILDLANDIVDRQKYLEFNKIRGTDIDELEHLKYQIFKWVKRLIGEHKMETIEHASELMELIRNIPVPMLNKSQDTLCKSNSVINDRYHKNDHLESGTSMTINNDNVRKSKSNTGTNSPEENQNHQNDSIFTNFVIHNVTTNNTNDARKKKPRRQTPSPPSRRSTTPSRSNTSVHNKSDSPKRSSKTQRNSNEGKQKYCNDKTMPNSKVQISLNVNSINASNGTQNIAELSDDTNRPEQINQDPGPSGLVTPIPPTSNGPSSAAAKLMADWRPPPVFTPPPVGRPLVGQIHDEFQDYLKTWVQQIPISTNTPDEARIAEKARLGILNGIWKIMAKIKTQPAVFQNKFYYEDVLGKEIDGLLDCLPQSQELKEKRYMLKSQLLEKTSNMNDLIKELQTPDNYKETVEFKVQEKKDEILRKEVKVDHENPSKMCEQLLKYCILDDFLLKINYQETNKIKASAYRINLLRNIQAYLDELKVTYGKEIEDNFSVVQENDIFRILHNVPLPNDDNINEDADEILLGLEIEQWMSNLPIVKNDDAKEQRQRLRLRDALTKKLHQMEKGANIAPCCGESQVKQEISFFLDKVPLERNQDLRINEMIEELTNRLKTRQSGRRKSVAFQDRHRSQQRSNLPSRLLNKRQFTNVTCSGANRLNMTADEWAQEEDEDAQYRNLFRNVPICSTRIDVLGDELAIEEGQDSQYRAFFKDRPACSTMIEPQSGYGLDNNAPELPNFHRQYEQEPYFVYAPGQFHESGRDGTFGYPVRSPQSDGRYQYPELTESPMMSRYGSHSQRYFDSGANIMSNVPLTDQYRPVKEPQSILIDKYMSMADARHAAPPMQASKHAAFAQPQGMDWEDQSEASGGFVSMADHRPPRHTRASSPRRSQVEPNMTVHGAAPSAGYAMSGQGGFVSMESPENPTPEMYISGRSFPNRQSKAFNSNLSRIDSNIAHNAPPGFLSSSRHERSLAKQGPPEAFIPHASGFSRPSNISRPNRDGMEPDAISVHEGLRSQNPNMLEIDSPEQGGFVSMANHQPPGEALPPAAPLETLARNQLLRQSLNQPERFRSENEPEAFVEIAREPTSEFQGTADREGTQETNQNQRTNRSAQNIQSSLHRTIQGVQNRSTGDTSMRQTSPTDRLNPEAVFRAPAAAAQRSDRGLLASNIPSTEISDQPAFFSTPNQRPGNLPPFNIKERHQMEKDRARRLVMETNEGEERCHCLERFKRWNRRGGASQCTTCDDCVDGGTPGFYPYPYPYMYSYPPFIRPPYPPYCRR